MREPRLRWPILAELPAKLAGRRVERIDRRGKYLIVVLDSGDRVILHLGMSGRILVLEPSVPLRKHDHVDWTLDSGRIMRFHDPRRFGAMLWWPAAETEHLLLRGMGPEPFSDAFDGDYLFRLSRGRSAAVQKRSGGALEAVARQHFAEQLTRRPIGITVQVDEGPEVFDAKISSLHPLFTPLRST